MKDKDLDFALKLGWAVVKMLILISASPSNYELTNKRNYKRWSTMPPRKR